MAALICLLWVCKWANRFGFGLIWIKDHENLGVDTKIIRLSFQISKLWSNNEISVLGALICILCKMPKGATPASSRFLICTLQRYTFRTKTLWGRQNHVHPKESFSQLDYLSCISMMQCITGKKNPYLKYEAVDPLVNIQTYLWQWHQRYKCLYSQQHLLMYRSLWWFQ